MKTYQLAFILCGLTIAQSLFAQKDPATTEIWSPVPPVVAPGKTNSEPPSDAIILFDGKSGDAWASKNNDAIKWTITDGALTIKPGTGDIHSKKKFGDCQLHIEWRIDKNVKGENQDRGNSGIFLMGRYELQVLDNYNNINKTYVNGQAGSMYKQSPPLVNACKAPGEWQSYDIIFMAPRFSDNGSVIIPAHITVLQNGVLVQNNTTIWGNTEYIGSPAYKKHESKEPLILQDHNHLTSYRNIWIREL